MPIPDRGRILAECRNDLEQYIAREDLEAVGADDVERDEAAVRAECLAEWRSDLEG